jgi:uncharacterized protein
MACGGIASRKPSSALSHGATRPATNRFSSCNLGIPACPARSPSALVSLDLSGWHSTIAACSENLVRRREELASLLSSVSVALATSEPFVDEREGQPPVRGFLHRPPRPSGDVLVLTHGASGNCCGPLLVALAEAFAAAGITVLRCDLAFRQARASGPPSPAWAARDQAGIRRAILLMKETHSGSVLAGGHSYGGRQTTMAAAAEPALADGLLLTSYPLHPPGRPVQLRTGHFPALRTPALFVSGTKDAFGSIAEIENAVKLIPARTQVVPVASAGHSLVTKANKETLPAMIVERFRAFVGR